MAVSAVQTDVQDTENWDTPELCDIQMESVDSIMSTKIKTALEVAPRKGFLNVNLYSPAYRWLIKTLKPGQTVRVSGIVLKWNPLGDDFTGQVIIMLVDTRYNDIQALPKSTSNAGIFADLKDYLFTDDKNLVGKIVGSVSLDPSRASLSFFWQNYGVKIDDIKYIRFYVLPLGLNIVKGSFARVDLGWKTIISDPTIYLKKEPTVIYLSKQEIPEFEILNPKKIAEKVKEEARLKHEQISRNMLQLDELIKKSVTGSNINEVQIEEKKREIMSSIKSLDEKIEKIRAIKPNNKHLSVLEDKNNQLKLIAENMSSKDKDSSEISESPGDSVGEVYVSKF